MIHLKGPANNIKHRMNETETAKFTQIHTHNKIIYTKYGERLSVSFYALLTLFLSPSFSNEYTLSALKVMTLRNTSLANVPDADMNLN